MSYAPKILSARTGLRVNRIFELIVFVYGQASLRISTGTLNDVLGDAIMRIQPPADRGKRLKIYYMTQTSVRPPTFVIFCNSAKIFHFSYRRYKKTACARPSGSRARP